MNARRLMLHLGALVVPLLTACSTQTAPPPDFAQEPTMPAAPALTVGARVQVTRGAQAYPATVMRDVGGGRFLVRYDGAGPEWDEVVGPDRIQADAAQAAAAADFRAGEKVLVTVQNRVVLANVLQQVAANQWRIHYDGYPPQYAENAGPDRLRRQFAGASAHPVGEALSVEVQGQSFPAKVIAVVAADKWMVRYDGRGPEFDQVVGADVLRARGAAATPAATPATPPAATPAVPAAPDATAKADKDKKDKDKKDKDKKDKAAKAEPPAAPAPAGPLQVGEDVLVLHRQSYHAAKITALGAPGKYKVKYENASADPEEEIGPERLTRLVTAPKGTTYAPQQKVFIEWHGMMFPGKVLKDSGKGQYKVRWDGTGPEADEVVISKRLRPRP